MMKSIFSRAVNYTGTATARDEERLDGRVLILALTPHARPRKLRLRLSDGGPWPDTAAEALEAGPEVTGSGILLRSPPSTDAAGRITLTMWAVPWQDRKHDQNQLWTHFSANADAIVAVVAGGEEISCSEEVARLREVWAALREAAAEGVLDTSGAHPHQQNAERALVVLVDSEGARDYGEEGCPIVRPQFREAPAALLQAGVPPDSMLRVDARSGEGVSDLMARICDAVSRRREAEGRSSSLCVVGAGVQEECLFVGAGGCEEVLQVQRS